MKKCFIAIIFMCLIFIGCTDKISEENQETYVEYVSTHTETLLPVQAADGLCVVYYLHYYDKTVEIENPTEENETLFTIDNFSIHGEPKQDHTAYKVHLGGMVGSHHSNANRFVTGSILAFEIVYGCGLDEVDVTIKFYDTIIFYGTCYRDKKKHNLSYS